MDIVEFVHQADPHSMHRVGAVLPDGRTLVDLQGGHFAMTGAPHPHLRDLATFQAGGDHAAKVAQSVVEWVSTQRPPGTTTILDAVRTVRR